YAKRSDDRVCFSIHRLTAAADFGSLECMASILKAVMNLDDHFFTNLRSGCGNRSEHRTRRLKWCAPSNFREAQKTRAKARDYELSNTFGMLVVAGFSPRPVRGMRHPRYH